MEPEKAEKWFGLGEGVAEFQKSWMLSRCDTAHLCPTSVWSGTRGRAGTKRNVLDPSLGSAQHSLFLHPNTTIIRTSSCLSAEYIHSICVQREMNILTSFLAFALLPGALVESRSHPKTHHNYYYQQQQQHFPPQQQRREDAPSCFLMGRRPAQRSSLDASLWGLRGGAEAATDKVLHQAFQEIQALEDKVENLKQIPPSFGTTADSICNRALSNLANQGISDENTLAEMERTIDAPLQVLYLKILSILREQALERYRTALQSASEYEAMLQADSFFVREASDATREEGGWDYTAERQFLQSIMNQLAASARQATNLQLTTAQQQQTAMQFLQSQQQMIQQLQMQLYGQTSPWNVGVAYRLPDTNFNLQGSYQQGKANLQLSCVPDEYAPFLGPNGFTNGVGPGNLGLSLNLSI